MLPRSPPCLTGVFGPPWCAPGLGLKGAPALMAAGPLQSPFSWMCTPWSPGEASWTVTSTTAPEAEGVTRAVPVTLLPLFGSRVATATETGPPSAGPTTATFGVPPSAMTAPAAAAPPSSAAPGPESGLLHPLSLASAGSVPPDGGPDEDEVAHPQARTTRSVARRMGDLLEAAEATSFDAVVDASAEKREPSGRSRVPAIMRIRSKILPETQFRWYERECVSAGTA